MSKHDELLAKVLSGASDANIRYKDLCNLLLRLGFSVREGKGSHKVFTYPGIPEQLTLQPSGNKAMPYQVKSVRRLITTHKLLDPSDE
ncbi:MAG: type II toxin-antitoxin system HicA family toxin [Bacteroidota bacterium]